MDSHELYLLLKFIINTILLLIEMFPIYMIIVSPTLRKSPTFCYVCLALVTHCFKTIIIFHGHDLPSALANKEFLVSLRWVFMFVGYFKWCVHMINLLVMTVNFLLRVYLPDFHKNRITPLRYRIISLELLLGAIFASPYVNIEAFGIQYNVEHLNFNIDLTIPIAAAYDLMNWIFLIVIAIILFASAFHFLILLFKWRMKKQIAPAAYEVESREAKLGIISRIKMIAVFLVLAASYYTRAILFNVVPKHFTQDSRQFFEIVDLIQDFLEGSKWTVFALCAAEFRKAVSNNFRKPTPQQQAK